MNNVMLGKKSNGKKDQLKHWSCLLIKTVWKGY